MSRKEFNGERSLLVVRIEMDSFRVKEMNLCISSIIRYYWLLGSTVPFGPISHGNEI
jgi:hypothetical protein